jgi:hypothetical protein
MNFGIIVKILHTNPKAIACRKSFGFTIALSPGIKNAPPEAFWSPALRSMLMQLSINDASFNPYFIKHNGIGNASIYIPTPEDILADDWTYSHEGGGDITIDFALAIELLKDRHWMHRAEWKNDSGAILGFVRFSRESKGYRLCNINSGISTAWRPTEQDMSATDWKHY